MAPSSRTAMPVDLRSFPFLKTELRHGGGPAERFRRSLSVDRRTVTLSKRRKQRATRQPSPLPPVDRGLDAAPSRRVRLDPLGVRHPPKNYGTSQQVDSLIPH